MNKKNMIIISITGIFLVLFILLGLTYAYFVTQIEGNSSDKSIEVTTADLLLTYSDGNGSITANNIMPGTTTEEKIFTVKNNGNQTVGNYKVYLENVINTFTNTSDVVINMTCTSSVEGKTCLGITDTMFPTTNDLLVSNSIDVGETQTYSLTVTYKETGVDQSVDMDKTFSGKIQIYDARNVVDISGTVSDAANGDYVELQSNPKVSQINNTKEYKIVGVTPGEHTLYIKASNGSVKGSKTIVINKSNNVSYEGTTINVTKEVSDVEIDVTSIDTNLEVQINNIILNPYSYNSSLLSYHIINNAQINKNRTTYEPTPITTPGTSINAVYNYEKDAYWITSNHTAIISLTETEQSYYWTYSDKISVDEITGKFSLVNPRTCKYSECYSSLIGKFVVGNTVATASMTTDTLKPSSELTNVYQVNGTTISTINFKRKIKNVPDSAERTISKTEDDYGESYYFRGDIKDNYVNFNGMCWRIMRIEGDGSVKLILEDKDTTCNSKTYTGDFKYAITSFGYVKDADSNAYKNDFLNSTTGLYEKLKEFQTNKMNGVLNKLKNDEWCYDDRAYSDTGGTTPINDLTPYYQNMFYYAGYKRIYIDKIPSFKCYGTKLTKYRDGTTPMYVGTFTADEVLFAGGKCGNENFNFYLINKWGMLKESSWTFTPMNNYPGNELVFLLYTTISLGSAVVENGGVVVRPSISLLSTTEIISGEGTRNNPYIIR